MSGNIMIAKKNAAPETVVTSLKQLVFTRTPLKLVTNCSERVGFLLSRSKQEQTRTSLVCWKDLAGASLLRDGCPFFKTTCCACRLDQASFQLQSMISHVGEKRSRATE